MKLTRLFFFVGALSFATLTQAQTDLALWSSIGVKKKWTKKIETNVNFQARLTDNITILRTYLAELGVGYKIGKHWEVAGYYRYIGRRRWNDDRTARIYVPNHRFFVDVSFAHKVGPFNLQNRVRYQNQFQDNDVAEEGNISYLRNKLELSYPNQSVFEPYVSADLFYQVGGTFEQLRNKVGVEIQLSKHHKLDLGAFVNSTLINDPQDRIFLSFGYKIKL
jgi:Protein of unknown function (DUF2490)